VVVSATPYPPQGRLFALEAETWAWSGALMLVGATVSVALLLAARPYFRRSVAGVWSDRMWRPALADVGMAVGTLPWLWLTLSSRPGQRVVILVPGRDLAGQLAEGLPNLVFQVTGNLLVFAAVGALAPLRYRIGVGAVVTIAVVGSAGIELAQYVLDIGRFSSVDDVVVNATGAGLAALATRRWWRRRRA
jgi:VanZ like family